MLHEPILNVFWNPVPSKYITVDDKDAVWMYKNIKSKTKTLKILRTIDMKVTLCFLRLFKTELNELISSAKSLCYKSLEKIN